MTGSFQTKAASMPRGTTTHQSVMQSQIIPNFVSPPAGKMPPMTVVKCGTNNTWELYGWTKNTAYTVEDKFYLASRPEVGLGAESMDQGSVFDYFNDAQNVDRIKRDSGSTARSWWLRSPNPSHAYYVRTVTSDGSLGNGNASGGHSAAAACEIG